MTSIEERFLRSTRLMNYSYGFNAEAGYLAQWKDKFLFYIAGGPYYLTKKGLYNRGGGEVRVRPQYKDYIALDLGFGYEQCVPWCFQAQVIVYLPLYQITSKKGAKNHCGINERQIYEPVERFEVMPLGDAAAGKETSKTLYLQINYLTVERKIEVF